MNSLHKITTLAGVLYSHSRGWRSNGHIVILDSDDWGTIRTSSRRAYDRLSALGYDLNRSPYSLDALETEEDLEGLFHTLDCVRDVNGRPACLTANTIVANPDFERIADSHFRDYCHEPVSVTLQRSPGRTGVVALWKEGLSKKLFVPQLHAREHVRFWDWMDALRSGDPEVTSTFSLHMCGVPKAVSRKGVGFFSAPYLEDDVLSDHGIDVEELVRQGDDLFRRQFGFGSMSVIAPNYCWTDHVEQAWASLGIRYIKSAVFQNMGRPDRRRVHFTGQHTSTAGRYLVRNCTFEPAWPGISWVPRCLREISMAFLLHQPAIICTHRVNYIGSIREENRREGLKQLFALLVEIQRRWNDVCFFSTAELGQMIERDIRDPIGLPREMVIG